MTGLESKREPLFNVPNLISILRILLVPVFLVLMATGKAKAAFGIFLVAASTDLLDGFAARLLKQKTRLGALLDPAGDKALMTAAVVIMSFPHISRPHALPIWLTLIILGRDLLLIGGAIVLFRRIGRKSFPPSLLGKGCTMLQMGVIVLMLFANARGLHLGFLTPLWVLTGIMTGLSGLHYVMIGIGWLREWKKSGARAAGR